MQRERVLARPGMTEEKFEALRARQHLATRTGAPRADYVVDSGTNLENMQAQLDSLIELLQDRDGRVMERLRR